MKNSTHDLSAVHKIKKKINNLTRVHNNLLMKYKMKKIEKSVRKGLIIQSADQRIYQ